MEKTTIDKRTIFGHIIKNRKDDERADYTFYFGLFSDRGPGLSYLSTGSSKLCHPQHFRCESANLAPMGAV